MKKQVKKNVIKDIAQKLKAKPSFIEKDLYALGVLKELASIDYDGAKLIFTGGTCLSKAYNIIKRFSEDIDFRIVTSTNFTRGQKKAFREFLIQKLKTLPDIKFLEDTLVKKNESGFFSFYVEYPKNFAVDNALRDGLKLEFTFENVLMPTNLCKIESIIAKYIKDAETAEIDCISPIEIGADKLSALMWRIDIKDRTKEAGSTANDATIIRHLHDLAALETLILKDDFRKCLEQSYATDKGRGGANADISLEEFAQKTLEKFKTDKIYEKEYKDFVEALSYASEAETITFTTAINAFKRIVEFIK